MLCEYVGYAFFMQRVIHRNVVVYQSLKIAFLDKILKYVSLFVSVVKRNNPQKLDGLIHLQSFLKYN